MRRNHLVHDTFMILSRMSSSEMLKKFKIQYENEEGIDSGGLTKDWFVEIARKLCDPSYCLFRRGRGEGGGGGGGGDGGSGSGSGSGGSGGISYDIDPRSSVNERHLDYYHVFGRILGKSIYDRHLIDVNFSTLFFRRLLTGGGSSGGSSGGGGGGGGLAKKWKLEDVEEDDADYGSSLRWLLDCDDIDEADLGLTFSVTRQSVSGATTEIPLIHDGINVEVTNKNKKEYVAKVVAWHCENCVRDQVSALRRGFFEMMPSEKINVFTVDELEQLIGGVKEVDVETLRNVCVYKGGYENEEEEESGGGGGGGGGRAVNYFWSFLGQLDLEGRRRVLRFITGTTRVPLDGFDPCLQICRASRDDEVGRGTKALPVAHTCFNQLVLPAYESVEMCHERFMYALDESDGTFGLT